MGERVVVPERKVLPVRIRSLLGCALLHTKVTIRRKRATRILKNNVHKGDLPQTLHSDEYAENRQHPTQNTSRKKEKN